MYRDTLIEILGLKEGTDFEYMNALDFEQLIRNKLSPFGDVKRQVFVADRGDGRGGRIDIVFTPEGSQPIPIEIDRKSARYKSVAKIKNFSQGAGYIILRSPFQVIEFK